MNRRLLVLILAILFVYPLLVNAEANFTGTWKKNAQQSDDPAKKFEEVMKERQAPGKPPGGRPEARMRPDRGGEGPGGLMRFPDMIMIEYNTPEMRLKGDNNWQRTFYTDGRKSEREVNSPRGKVNVITTSRWEGERLTVETQGPGGGKSTTTYELAPDGKQLFVQIRMQPMFANEPVTIRYVYDAAQQAPQSQIQQ